MNFLKRFAEFLSLNEDEFTQPKRVTPFSQEYTDGKIPVFNSLKYRKGMTTSPEATLSEKNLVSAIKELLAQQKDGAVDEIRVTADVPTQGKNAPQYLRDELEAERKRIRDKILKPFGGRIEASDYPEIACTTCSGTGKIEAGSSEVPVDPLQANGTGQSQMIDCTDCQGKGTIREKPQEYHIFTDVEFVVTGTGIENGKEYVVASPISKKTKIARDPNLANYYKVNIYPRQIEEVFFDPY